MLFKKAVSGKRGSDQGKGKDGMGQWFLNLARGCVNVVNVRKNTTSYSL